MSFGNRALALVTIVIAFAVNAWAGLPSTSVLGIHITEQLLTDLEGTEVPLEAVQALHAVSGQLLGKDRLAEVMRASIGAERAAKWLPLVLEAAEKSQPWIPTPNRDLQVSAVPANDVCTNAVLLPCGVAMPGTTTGATFDDVGLCGTSNTGPGVWYKVVGTGNNITASTCGAANFDTKLSIFSGGCGALVCLDGEDDEPWCPGHTSNVTWLSTLGTTYYILVHGYHDLTGDFTLSIECLGPPPVNDTCTGAIALDCGESVTGNTESATPDATPDCGTSTGGRGVWYKVVGTDADMVASTCADLTNYDSKISVYTGLCDALVCVAANDDDDACSFGTLRSTVSWNGTAGTTYFILVHGWRDKAGDFELSVGCSGVVPQNPGVPCTGGCPSPLPPSGQAAVILGVPVPQAGGFIDIPVLVAASDGIVFSQFTVDYRDDCFGFDSIIPGPDAPAGFAPSTVVGNGTPSNLAGFDRNVGLNFTGNYGPGCKTPLYVRFAIKAGAPDICPLELDPLPAVANPPNHLLYSGGLIRPTLCSLEDATPPVIECTGGCPSPLPPSGQAAVILGTPVPQAGGFIDIPVLVAASDGIVFSQFTVDYRDDCFGFDSVIPGPDAPAGFAPTTLVRTGTPSNVVGLDRNVGLNFTGNYGPGCKTPLFLRFAIKSGAPDVCPLVLDPLPAVAGPPNHLLYSGGLIRPTLCNLEDATPAVIECTGGCPSPLPPSGQAAVILGTPVPQAGGFIDIPVLVAASDGIVFSQFTVDYRDDCFGFDSIIPGPDAPAGFAPSTVVGNGTPSNLVGFDRNVGLNFTGNYGPGCKTPLYVRFAIKAGAPDICPLVLDPLPAVANPPNHLLYSGGLIRPTLCNLEDATPPVIECTGGCPSPLPPSGQAAVILGTPVPQAGGFIDIPVLVAASDGIVFSQFTVDYRDDCFGFDSIIPGPDAPAGFAPSTVVGTGTPSNLVGFDRNVGLNFTGNYGPGCKTPLYVRFEIKAGAPDVCPLVLDPLPAVANPPNHLLYSGGLIRPTLCNLDDATPPQPTALRLIAINDVAGEIGADQLVKFTDIGTGAASLVGSLGSHFRETDGLATLLDPDRLYAIDDNRLLTLDPLTGNGTVIGPVNFDDVEGIAFNPLTDVLYGVTFHTNKLITIDLTTGAGTAVHTILPGRKLNDPAFHPNGDLYVLTEDPPFVHLVDLATGALLHEWELSGGSEMEGLLWSVDGSTLYSTADGASTKDLVTIELHDDAPSGSIRGTGTVSFVGGSSGFHDLEALAWLSDTVALFSDAPTDVSTTPGAVRHSLQNRPNPFNPATHIEFELGEEQHATLEVHDVTGRLVVRLFDGRLPAGLHEVAWLGQDARGSKVPAGIYYCTLRGSGWVESRAMALVK